jgi:hypothetical protein
MDSVHEAVSRKYIAENWEADEGVDARVRRELAARIVHPLSRSAVLPQLRDGVGKVVDAGGTVEDSGSGR